MSVGNVVIFPETSVSTSTPKIECGRKHNLNLYHRRFLPTHIIITYCNILGMLKRRRSRSV